MLLLRMLYFVAAKYDFTVTSMHLPSRCNILEDAISRNQVNISVPVLSQLTQISIPSHQPSSTLCAIWRYTGHRTIVALLLGEGIATSTARLYRFGHVIGGYASTLMCCLSQRRVDTDIVLVRCVIRRCSTPFAPIKCYMSAVRHI